MKNQESVPSVWQSKRFLSVFLSQTFVDFGDQFLLVGLGWTVLHALGSVALGLVLSTWSIPRGILLMFGGVLADRSDRKMMAIGTALSVGLLTLVLGFLIQHKGASLWLWLIFAALLGVFDALRLPIGSSLIPLVLPHEQIVNANRWTQLREWGTLAGGPALGGIVLALIGETNTFWVISGLYFISSLFLLTLPSLPPSRSIENHVLQDLGEGFRWVVRDNRLRILLPTFALANLFILGLSSVGMVVFSKSGLNAGAEGLGYLSGSFGVGLALGTLLMPILPKRLGKSLSAIFALFVLSDLALAAVGLFHSLFLSCTAYALSGILAGPAATMYRSSLQTLTPPDYLGRVNSIARALSFGLQPVSTAMYGTLATSMSGGLMIVLGGLCATVMDLLGVAACFTMNRKNEKQSELQEDVAPIYSE